MEADALSQELENIANQLMLVQRSSDLVARTRPDTFTLMLPETSGEGASIVAERTKAALNQCSPSATICTSVMTSLEGTEDPHEMLEAAEEAALAG